MDIAFLGLGIMGSRMAANVAKKHSVRVWNRTPKDVPGARTAKTPEEAAKGADAVCLCLANPAAVEFALSRIELTRGMLLVDFSTISVALAKRIDEVARTKGARYLEAPMTGSKNGAAAGTLVLMCGGDAETIEAAKPILDCVASKVLHVGAAGTATRVKLVGNTVIAMMLEALCEGFVICDKAGIGREKLLEVIQASGYASPYWDFKGKAILAKDFDAHFTADLMHKDLTLAMESANELRVPVPGLAAVREQFQVLRAMGAGGEDIAALIKVLEASASTSR